MAPVSLVSINGSHSASSSTHAVATLAAEVYGSGEIVDLVTLDPAGLIGTTPSPDVAGLLAAIGEASILVLVTPIYRATYSGLLKVVFDQLPAGGLKGKAAVLAATAGGPAHYLALDTGMRSLVASLDGWTVPTVTYAMPADFDEQKNPSENVRASLEVALAEAVKLVS
jgi:FMN reductase